MIDLVFNFLSFAIHNGYRAVSHIIILAARNIMCGKNDRSKMKDSGMGGKNTVYFYFIAIVLIE